MSGDRGALTFPEVFALPLAVDLRTAARAFAICRTTAYRLVAHDAFPCPVLRIGRQYRIPTSGLLGALGIERRPVRAADLLTGTEYAARHHDEPFTRSLLEDFA
ncbi:DNA-binding protein [Kitasatospora sp. NPDC093558]|uniref:DNA-binding protein n=1 Tax=Kitasatospora sp. NPDC093558 TaxID=3155201 RepID=UPI00343F76C5